MFGEPHRVECALKSPIINVRLLLSEKKDFNSILGKGLDGLKYTDIIFSLKPIKILTATKFCEFFINVCFKLFLIKRAVPPYECLEVLINGFYNHSILILLWYDEFLGVRLCQGCVFELKFEVHVDDYSNH